MSRSLPCALSARARAGTTGQSITGSISVTRQACRLTAILTSVSEKLSNGPIQQPNGPVIISGVDQTRDDERIGISPRHGGGSLPHSILAADDVSAKHYFGALWGLLIDWRLTDAGLGRLRVITSCETQRLAQMPGQLRRN